MTQVPHFHRQIYTIYGLLAAGSRFVDDYSEQDAIEDYLDLHPEADRQAVTEELKAELAKRAP